MYSRCANIGAGVYIGVGIGIGVYRSASKVNQDKI